MKLSKRHAVYILLFHVASCAPAALDPAEKMPDCSKYRCEREPVRFAPEPGLLAATEQALERFRVATGRTDLAIDPAGIPVVWADELITDERDESTGELIRACGMTTAVRMKPGPFVTQRIQIDPSPGPGCPDAGLSIMHELIHALAPAVGHSTDPESLFYKNIHRRIIDESALIQLCSGFECNDFIPER